MRKVTMLLLLGVAAMGFAGIACDQAEPPPAGAPPERTPPAAKLPTETPPAPAAAKDVVDTAVAAGTFKTLATALTKADLIAALKAEGPFTVFAPTDDAFAALPEGALDGLLADVPKLKAVLLYHVVSGKVMAADAIKLDGQSAKTLGGAMLPIKVVNGKVTVGGATVTSADVGASNGVIHVIDKVLMPPEK